MTKIVEYIMLNYTWFLIGAIIILLAIIGSYADKTNFGQGKNKPEDDEDKKNSLEFDEINIGYNSDNVNQENEVNTIEEKENNEIVSNDNNIQSDYNNNSMKVIERDTKSQSDEHYVDENNRQKNNTNIFSYENPINSEISTLEKGEDVKDKKNNFEENFNKFDEEFNTLLPKKDIIDNDILEDIDNLSLEKTQKISLDEIPDLDDVELPKIKNLKTEDDNIWKF